MKSNTTKNLLVKRIYKEASLSEKFMTDSELSKDAELRESLYQLKAGFNKLPKATFSPSTASIKNILDYSSATAFEAQH